MTRAFIDLLADPVPGGYPGRRGSTRGDILRYTGRIPWRRSTRVEHHTVYRVPLVGTDPRGGDISRTLGSAAGG